MISHCQTCACDTHPRCSIHPDKVMLDLSSIYRDRKKGAPPMWSCPTCIVERGYAQDHGLEVRPHGKPVFNKDEVSK